VWPVKTTPAVSEGQNTSNEPLVKAGKCLEWLHVGCDYYTLTRDVVLGNNTHTQVRHKYKCRVLVLMIKVVVLVL